MRVLSHYDDNDRDRLPLTSIQFTLLAKKSGMSINARDTFVRLNVPTKLKQQNFGKKDDLFIKPRVGIPKLFS